MKMITAEESTTKGQIKIGSHMVESNDSRGFEYLGYCPQVCYIYILENIRVIKNAYNCAIIYFQFDAVWKNITIREHLNLYAAIRGIPPARISRYWQLS